MCYIAYDENENSFFLTDNVDEGVYMNGKLLAYDDDAEALDLVDDFNNSFDKEPPIGIDVHYCAKHARYNVDVKGQHTCTCN